MSSLLVLGAGGHGKVVADAAMLMKCWEHIAFADDASNRTAAPLPLEVVGTLADLDRLKHRFDGVALGLGNNQLRLDLASKCRALGIEMHCVVHPAAAVSSYARIGAGTVVLAQAAINQGAVLGAACIVNTGATVDHDCVLSDAVHISPGAHLAGGVHVGARTWIGLGAAVRERVVIGAGATVGAGSVVVSNVEAGTTVLGIPARAKS